METPVLNPTDPLTVILEAQQWNVVMTALHEAALPYRVTAPVVEKLTQQFQERTAAISGGSAFAKQFIPRMHGNGEDTAA